MECPPPPAAPDIGARLWDGNTLVYGTEVTYNCGPYAKSELSLFPLNRSLKPFYFRFENPDRPGEMMETVTTRCQWDKTWTMYEWDFPKCICEFNHSVIVARSMHFLLCRPSMQ